MFIFIQPATSRELGWHHWLMYRHTTAKQMKYLLPDSKNGERSEDKDGGRGKNDMIICDKNMQKSPALVHTKLWFRSKIGGKKH